MSRGVRSSRQFIDKLRIYCSGGRGGSGSPKVNGKGGDGGSVFMEASERVTLTSLRDKFPEKRFIAGHGADASKRLILGQKGSDVTVKVPPGISVMLDSGECLGDLNGSEERLLVARGGDGGSKLNGYSGQVGQARTIILDLKLLADVGLVGFPNAGKSSLLRAVSRAQPKVANYPFTTLRPNLGFMEFEEDGRHISLADLPGLVEGAHVNVGLGHHFLKHVERTKCLLFVVDISGFQFYPKAPHRSALQTVLLLCRELELYKHAILDKPALCAINKIDLPNVRDQREELKYKVENLQETLRMGHDDDDIRQLAQEDLLPTREFNFEEVFLISAQENEGVPDLKNGVRRWLDDFARREKVNYNMPEESKNDVKGVTRLDELDESHPAFKENMPTLV